MGRIVIAGVVVSFTLLVTPIATYAQGAKLPLMGRLLDRTTRAPIRAGVVELEGRKRRVLTDTLGRFLFTDVPAGRHVLSASALGYRQTVAPVETGSPAVLLLSPEPVPLAAIEALARPSRRSVRGIPLRVFGRDQLLAAGDISAAEFVRHNVHMTVRPCSSFDWGMITRRVMPLASQKLDPDHPGRAMEGVSWRTLFANGAPPQLSGRGCIVGSAELRATGRGRLDMVHGPVAGPFVVMVDGQPAVYSEELWNHRAWDLARVEVLYQRGGVLGPMAVVRLYSVPYLARVAARVGDMCDHPSRSAVAADSLAAVCGW